MRACSAGGLVALPNYVAGVRHVVHAWLHDQHAAVNSLVVRKLLFGVPCGQRTDDKRFASASDVASDVASLRLQRSDSLTVLSKAAESKGGGVLPLASALLRIPAHAFALKKYFDGIDSL